MTPRQAQVLVGLGTAVAIQLVVLIVVLVVGSDAAIQSHADWNC
jgi:hypothetical protein